MKHVWKRVSYGGQEISLYVNRVANYVSIDCYGTMWCYDTRPDSYAGYQIMTGEFISIVGHINNLHGDYILDKVVSAESVRKLY